jgi:hypothetical protein
MNPVDQLAGVDTVGKLVPLPVAFLARAFDQVADLEVKAVFVNGHDINIRAELG